MGYGIAPWTFKGRALYQLQLVRAEEARKYIPDDFDLVECFGWTLGGVYLARYDDSPVGAFDEAVVMAGLVWNAPLSCAWAARVFVSDRTARDHGLGHVGLPSRLAAFDGPSSSSSSSGGGEGKGNDGSVRAARGRSSWWRKGPAVAPSSSSSGAAAGLGAALAAGGRSGSGGKFVDEVVLRNTERGARGLAAPVATLRLAAIPTAGFLGPRLRLSLPSFSGGTAEHPALLKYSCDLQTNVMPVAPIDIALHHSNGGEAAEEPSSSSSSKRRRWWPAARGNAASSTSASGGGEVLDALLAGRPLVALAFSDMVMQVEEPVKLGANNNSARAPSARANRAALLATVPPRP